MDLKKLGLITRFILLLNRSIALQMIALQAQKIKIKHCGSDQSIKEDDNRISYFTKLD